MKNLFCWNFDDIKSLKLNARRERSSLKPKTRRGLERIMAPDYKFYYYFKSIFDSQLREFGQDKIKQELRALHQVNSAIQEQCNFQAASNKELPKDQKMWGFGNMMGFKVYKV